jgi:hypothetical protein
MFESSFKVARVDGVVGAAGTRTASAAVPGLVDEVAAVAVVLTTVVALDVHALASPRASGPPRDAATKTRNTRATSPRRRRRNELMGGLRVCIPRALARRAARQY